MTTRATCYFCGERWGDCTCDFPDAAVDKDAPGFEFRGVWITQPNVSECGRFFVDPVAYYGTAYTEWKGAPS